MPKFKCVLDAAIIPYWIEVEALNMWGAAEVFAELNNDFAGDRWKDNEERIILVEEQGLVKRFNVRGQLETRFYAELVK